MPRFFNVNSGHRNDFPVQLVEFAEKVVAAIEEAVECTPSYYKTETPIYTLHPSKTYTHYITLKIKWSSGKEAERTGKGESPEQASERVIEQWMDFFEREYPGYLNL